MSEKTRIIEPSDWDAQKYDRWYDKYEAVYLSEVHAVQRVMPIINHAVEIGVGTGRIASKIGINLGIEPSATMSVIAKIRGIDVIRGKAENLPFANTSFDQVLLVTSLSFIQDVKKALDESYRVLNQSGSIVVGFLDFGTSLGRALRETETHISIAHRKHFHTADDVANALRKAGFSNLRFVQTLFKPLEKVKRVEPGINGYGQGLFVVVKAEKNIFF